VYSGEAALLGTPPGGAANGVHWPSPGDAERSNGGVTFLGGNDVARGLVAGTELVAGDGAASALATGVALGLAAALAGASGARSDWLAGGAGGGSVTAAQPKSSPKHVVPIVLRKPRVYHRRRMLLELAAYLLLAAAGFAALFGIGSEARRLAIAAAVGLSAVAALALPRSATPAPAGAPASTPRGEFVTSNACRSCHPGEHASFHASFHRTMTQTPTRESVKAPFAGESVEVEGRTVTLTQRNGAFFAELPDPDWVARATLSGSPAPAAAAPLVMRQVALVTGSHHYQVYWVKGARGNELRLVPVAYLLDDRRYAPRRDAFLMPPDAPEHAVRWNSNCIQCHTTGGRPRHQIARHRFASEVVELGISCEACHGPGGEHVARHRNPLERYVSRASSEHDGSIVNPARLAPERSVEVCGQCHAYFTPRDESRFWSDGFAASFRPGDVLEQSRELVRPGTSATDALLVDAPPESLFWGDGTMRVGGRELNALTASACFTRGAGKNKITCLSCHSMHRSEPDDQLHENQSPDTPCRDCHASTLARDPAHTRHRPDSPGSSCVNCHMPFTTYALFKGIRSHRIDSPNAAVSARGERPNACNLCHVDKTLAWTAEKLGELYGASAVPVSDAQRSTSQTLLDLLSGDAAERAIAAYARGRPESAQAAGNDFQAAFLAELLDDPYSAVRRVAGRALASFPEGRALAYDYLAPEHERAEKRTLVLERFRARGGRKHAASLLFDERGARDDASVRALLARRDERPIFISE
jgi:hypothetical protein